MQTRAPLFTPVLIAGCIVIMLGFAIRASFGVFQIPIAEEFGWPRAEFSFAIAIQNLAWGIGQPLFGALAEKFGDRRAIVLGALSYAAGLVLSSFAITPGQHQFLEVLVGFGIAGTGFGVILAVVGRAASAENRSLALGIATAAGSAGQVIGAPVAEALLAYFPWQTVFLIFAAVILSALFVLPMMRAPAPATKAELEESMGEVLLKAFRDPSFALIFLGFFSCGYQLAFITAHFPAFVTEMCGAIDPSGTLASLGVSTTSALGAVAISLIGLANIVGTITAGWPGQALYEEVSAGRDLYRADHRRGGLHPGADDTRDGDPVLGRDGRALACHRAADQRSGRPYLRAALYGDALRHRLFLAPARVVCRRLARRADV